MHVFSKLFLPLLLVAGGAWAQPGPQTALPRLPAVDVYKNPSCGCCGEWVEHMRKNGFQVRVHETADLSAARRKTGMPELYASCHSARIGAYALEGHIPASDIKRLLKEQPKALGLAVLAMPPGSPGMEGSQPVPYASLLIQADGSNRIFARH